MKRAISKKLGLYKATLIDNILNSLEDLELKVRTFFNLSDFIAMRQCRIKGESIQ